MSVLVRGVIDPSKYRKLTEGEKGNLETYPSESITQILSHRSSRLLQIYVFPWNPGAMQKEKSSRRCARRKSPKGRPSRRAMVDASCKCSLLDLMHVRHDHSATPIASPTYRLREWKNIVTSLSTIISREVDTRQNKTSFCRRICRPFSAYSMGLLDPCDVFSIDEA